MKVLNFDGSDYLSMDDVEFDSERIARSRGSRSRVWWDEEDVPRRFRRKKVKRTNRAHRPREDWSHEE